MMNDTGDLVDVTTVAPDVVVEMRYAVDGGPFGAAMYPVNRAYLRRACATKLADAEARVAERGFHIKVWDAYRPLSVQAAMWRVQPDEDFVAPPTRGSRHNRGAAVDVTLVDINGHDIPMPTDFDDFTPAARSDAACSLVAAEHRAVLRNAMKAAGFTGISSEWWHFDDADWRRYGVCDVAFEDLPAPPEGRGGSTSR